MLLYNPGAAKWLLKWTFEFCCSLASQLAELATKTKIVKMISNEVKACYNKKV